MHIEYHGPMDIKSNGLIAMTEHLLSLGKPDTALEAAETFAREAPNDPQLLYLIGSLAYQARRFERVLEVGQALTGLGHADAIVRLHMARALLYLKRAPEALPLLCTLAAEHPQDPDYTLMLAQCLMALGQWEESRPLLDGVPHEVRGWHLIMGSHLVHEGAVAQGFNLFAKERGLYPLAHSLGLDPEKIVRADTDIAGKTVLLLLEGGYGDEIFGSRMAHILRSRGAHVLPVVSPRMYELARYNMYLEGAVTRAEAAHIPHDYYIPALLCMGFFDINDSSDCRFPYIEAPMEEQARVAPALDAFARGRRKIGIHWQGNLEFDYLEQKSLPAETMLHFGDAGALYNLQRNPGTNALPADAPVYSTEEDEASWIHTAATVACMDVVITNDTALAHLSGAMGKRTLLLLPHTPHIYWLAPGGTSVWYPSVQLYRAPRYGDWQGAVEAALRDLS